MSTGLHHWLFAGVAALVVHGVLLREIVFVSPKVQTDSESSQLAVSFTIAEPEQSRPVIDLPSDEPAYDFAEPEPEPEPEPESKPEPEPEPRSPPLPISKPKPKVRSVSNSQAPSAPKPIRRKPRAEPSVPASRSTNGGEQRSTPQPQKISTTAAPSPSASQLKSYYEVLGQLIAREKRYPRMALRRRQQGIVKLRLRIAADGAIVSVEVAVGSKHRALDEAALRLVRNAGRFPKPPVGADTPLEVVVPVRYQLR